PAYADALHLFHYTRRLPSLPPASWTKLASRVPYGQSNRAPGTTIASAACPAEQTYNDGTMASQTNELLEILLRECQAAAPEPWYPSDYARQTGVARETIDADLDRLRLAGLLRLSDWVQGKGQGYVLTPEG